MPVSIHGNQYYTVAERLQEAREALVAIHTEIVSDDVEQVTVQATVTIGLETGDRIFQGHARSRKNAATIEGQSPLEVAETSAVGRALGFAGFGVIDGVASADEIERYQPAESRSVPDPRVRPPDRGDDPYCPVHGKSRRGRDNYFCPTKVGAGWCDWKQPYEPENVPGDGELAEIPYG